MAPRALIPWIKNEVIVCVARNFCDDPVALGRRGFRIFGKDRYQQVVSAVRKEHNARIVGCSTDRAGLMRDYRIFRKQSSNSGKSRLALLQYLQDFVRRSAIDNLAVENLLQEDV